MPPFKDEHILIIAPGSQTTLAQLGLPESYTPARLRVYTRMFPAEKNGEWEPIKVREKKVKRRHAADNTTATTTTETTANGNADGNGANETPAANGDSKEEIQYEEDPRSDEGAVYPLVQGAVANWSCFFALLTHIYNTLSPPFHTPILMIAQPAWTVQDQEAITQFVFEKFRSPAFALMDAALATIYAYNTPTATIVDVGHGKTDVTAVADFTVTGVGRGIALADCGGEHMTDRLEKLLSDKGFTRDMTEQLKRSNICEVLAPGTPLPTAKDDAVNPAAAASTGVNGVEAPPKNATAPNGLPRGPGQGTEVGGEEQADDDEGVLDVASLVTSGKTNEFLARKEKEKAERQAAKRGGDAPLLPKATRLQNAQRTRNTFYFVEQRLIEEDENEEKMDVDAATPAPEPEPTTAPASAPTAPANEQPPPVSEPAPVPEPAPASGEATTETATAEPKTEELKAEPVAEAPPDEVPPVEAPPADAAPAQEAPKTDAAEVTPGEAAPTEAPATESTAPAAPAPAEGSGEADAQTQSQDDAADGIIAPASEAEAPMPAPPAVVVEPPPAEPAAAAPAPKKERVKVQESSKTIRTEMEVGVERFQAADDGLLEQIADAVHRVILSVPEIHKRSELWDALVVLGNGSKVRGFKDALLATLNSKYLISPSSATIFTSELPSNMSTPAGTGANTPQPQQAPTHHASGVNPLLIAATTASNPALAPPSSTGGAQTPQQPSSGGAAAGAIVHHSGHGQTPTSIKMAKMAEYFPEWKEHGFEEAHFLGAQVAAKILFILDQGSNKGFMSRSEYNELGPQGIHEYAMC